jgi:hypothetical protein
VTVWSEKRFRPLFGLVEIVIVVSKIKFLCLQSVLEKFEFFPIKCRTQRAFEVNQMKRDAQEAKTRKKGSSFKIKVNLNSQCY